MVSQYERFFYWLGQITSGNAGNSSRINATNQYRKIENPSSRTGKIGKYQLTENMLAALGYYTFAKGDNGLSNQWRGRWTGRRGLLSLDNFQENGETQEYIARELMRQHWRLIRRNHLDELVGTKVKGLLLTESSLLAIAHLMGDDGVVALAPTRKSMGEIGLSALMCVAGFQTPYDINPKHDYYQEQFQQYIANGTPITLNADLQNVAREEVDEYVWCTRGDDKVRPEHEANDGETFSIDNPPATGAPGDEENCRCWAEWNMSDSYNPAEAKQENTTFSPTDIKISTAGSTFIAQWEKFKPNVYLDAAKRPTIGFGHLLRPGESYANGITYEDALKLLKEDLATAENSVSRNVISNLSQNQYDALVSLTYNIGNGAFKDSTLLRLLNQGDYQGAADQFLRWNKITVDGKVMESAGLANRRASEKELFESGAYD